MQTNIEKALKSKAKGPKKINKISKLVFIVNLYQGKPGREGDNVPAFPVTEVKELASKVRDAEEAGYFRVRTDTKVERNDSKYESEVKWYLTQAAKKKLINKEYKPRRSI